MERYSFPNLAQTNVVAARQAIVGADGGVFGYELLWRQTAADHRADVLDDYDATMRALFAVGMNFGWSQFFNASRAFVNVGLEFIDKHLYCALPPQGCVLELRPFHELQGQQRFELIHARRLGYQFAWDGVTSTADPRLDLVKQGDYVKIDCQTAAFQQVLSLLDLCAARKLLAIVYKVETEPERAFLVARGAHAVQGQVLHRTESRLHLQLPAPPADALHGFRDLLLDARPMPERVKAVENCPEMLLALLMLTDVVWQSHWPYPNTVEQILRGISRDAVMAWLDIMLYQLYRESPARRKATAFAMLKPAIFARMASRKLCPEEAQLHEEAFLGGFIAQIRCMHPDLVESQRAPIRLGHTLQRTLAVESSSSNALFNAVWALSRADALGEAPNLSPDLNALAQASTLAALDALEGPLQPHRLPSPTKSASRETFSALA